METRKLKRDHAVGGRGLILERMMIDWMRNDSRKGVVRVKWRKGLDTEVRRAGESHVTKTKDA